MPESTHPTTQNIGWQALSPTIACTAIATVVVALRWYTRCRLLRCLGTDDYVILWSLTLCWAMLAVVAVAKNQGMGVYDTGLVHATYLAKLLVAYNDLWALTVGFTKVSILMQYLRIFSSRATRAACYMLLFLLVIATCWAVFGGTFLCRPVRKLWYASLPGHCMHAEKYWISVAALNITLDLSVLILPLPAMASLRLPPTQKLALLLVFLLGFVVCVISIIRLVLVIVTASNGDYVQSGVWSIIWSIAEANVGVICASLLALKPLLVRLWPGLMDEADGDVPEHCMRLPVVQDVGLPAMAIQVGSERSVTLHSREDSAIAGRVLESPKITSWASSGSDHLSCTDGVRQPL